MEFFKGIFFAFQLLKLVVTTSLPDLSQFQDT